MPGSGNPGQHRQGTRSFALSTLLASQNTSARKETTSIPTTFLRGAIAIP